MANYSATVRTNYFRVQSVPKFKAWVESIPGLVLLDTDGCKVEGRRGKFFGLYSDDIDTGAWPSWRFNDSGDIVDAKGKLNDDAPLDLFDELSKHLKPGSVAVFMEAGHEKLRYIHGSAIAVNHKGETVVVNLNEIYKKAKKLGPEITEAEY